MDSRNTHSSWHNCVRREQKGSTNRVVTLALRILTDRIEQGEEIHFGEG